MRGRSDTLQGTDRGRHFVLSSHPDDATEPLKEVVPQAPPHVCKQASSQGGQYAARSATSRGRSSFLPTPAPSTIQFHADSVAEAGYKADLQVVAALPRHALGFPLLSLARLLLAPSSPSTRRLENGGEMSLFG
jgi:hypothetical protein